jgi:ketosteroid isomerase-like protein
MSPPAPAPPQIERRAQTVRAAADCMEGREAITAFWKAGIESGISAVDLEPREIERRDGLAYEIGRYALRLRTADGGTVIDRGNYLLVHERQPDGTWQRAVEMFSPCAPPARSRGARSPAPGPGSSS